MPASSPSTPSATANPQPQHTRAHRPSRDPTCRLCRHPNREPFVFDPDNRAWEVGDIVMLNESIHLPVDSVLGNKSRRQTAGPSSAGGGTRGKDRSAVVWEITHSEGEAAEQDTGVRYVMMASYESLHTYDTLPDILKLHFAVPVSPHCEICPQDSHLHTCPEWQAHHIWVVAIPFKSDGHVHSRWGWKDVHRVRQKEKGFTIEESAWIELQSAMESRMADWSKACRSRKDYFRKCKEEYNVFKNPEMWARHLAERDREKAAAAHADQIAAEENTSNPGQETTSKAECSTPSGDTPSTVPPSEDTLAGSASDANKKEAAGTQAPRSAVDAAQGNGGTLSQPGADDDGKGPWKTVGRPKKSNKLKKPRQPERQRTISGKGLLGEWMGSMKGRTTQSHK